MQKILQMDGVLIKRYIKKLMQAGISLLTMGNHTWKNPELKNLY